MNKLSLTGASLGLLLALAAGASAATYTSQDVAGHATSTDCWTSISGKVYNLTGFTHPGGQAAINSLCGKDGTAAYQGKHGQSTTTAAALASRLIGDLQVSTSTATTTPPKATSTKKFKFRGDLENRTKLINLRSNELVNAYVFGSSTLDVREIDLKTVRLAGASSTVVRIRDLNRDNIMDAVFSFRAKQMTELNKATSSQTVAILSFSTRDGKAYTTEIKVRVKYWKTEKQRLEEKKRAEQLKKQLEQKREQLKKQEEQKREELKRQLERKREDLKRWEEKQQEQLKKLMERKREELKKQEKEIED